MITGIILYFVIAISLVLLFTKLQKKYKNRGGTLLILFFVLIMVICIVTTFLPVAISNRTIIGDSEIIHEYHDIGTLYYDSHTDTYFIGQFSPWNIIKMWTRVDIDYELGKSIHDAKDLINSSEDIFISMIK